MTTPYPGRGRPAVRGLTIAAAVLTFLTVALVWFVAVPLGPEVCAASYPPPRNCHPNSRASAGFGVTVLGVVVGLATMLLAVTRFRARRPLMIAGVVILAATPIVAYLLVAWIPAFAYMRGIVG